MSSLQDKEYCEYCHGWTLDDSRGGCINCGALRQKKEERNFYDYGIVDRKIMRNIIVSGSVCIPGYYYVETPNGKYGPYFR
jgi:hypothetical protein